ncbi:hypothetical protein [Verminephrobacter eiseniae]|uniref:hypothetical protein n=1 Tax=Verminephrobacter eiseniae TaxID=364317 RepID=UPI002238BEF4|nr:hypothetical protein [Verminephrobacter eiseniae]MCW5237780.1 hypothetical protein [Verminephrobacter eiseniae]
MSILKNAVESIQVGVEDFENSDERRSVSALRNITAGLLLLFKAKLCELSPEHDKELLIKKDLVPQLGPDGKVNFIGKGKKTVDVFQLQKRLSSMQVKVDWNRVKEITDLRNDIEHYYAKASPDAVREIVAKSFLLIQDFAKNELNKNPQELLGNDCWQVLLNTNEVYLDEERSCKESLGRIDWKYSTVKNALDHLRCLLCGSALIEAPSDNDKYPTINLHCRSCGHVFAFNDVVEECVDKLDKLFAHQRRPKDGGNSLYETCPGCGKGTFIHKEACCVACEQGLDYVECSRCSEQLSFDDQIFDGMCSYCRYVYNKLMAE